MSIFLVFEKNYIENETNFFHNLFFGFFMKFENKSMIKILPPQTSLLLEM